MSDERFNGPPRRRRPEDFKVQIPQDELEGPRREDINSYSDPNASRQPDMAQAVEKAERAHQERNLEKRRKNRSFFRLIWLAVVILIGVTAGQYLVSGMYDMLAVGRSKVNVTVDIPEGSSTDKIAELLQQQGVIKRTDFFRLYSKIRKADGNYNSGTYKIDTDMDYEAIINHLQSDSNRVDIVTITFPEGVNALEIAQLLEKNGVCSQSEALAALKGSGSAETQKYSFLQDIKNSQERYYKLEGYLFPDTYDFFKNESPEQAIAKLLNNSKKKFSEELMKQVNSSGMSLDEVLTLASMIQAEAASEDDMYNISSVFHNRLESGNKDGLLRLQSDPTMYYPYRSKALVPSDIRETYVSRYSTYSIQGLPPGPICNPGEKAIDAALHPKDTNYYYFCHDAQRKPYYAKTLSEHQKNLKKAGLR